MNWLRKKLMCWLGIGDLDTKMWTLRSKVEAAEESLKALKHEQDKFREWANDLHAWLERNCCSGDKKKKFNVDSLAARLADDE